MVIFFSVFSSTLFVSSFYLWIGGLALCHDCNAREKAAAIGKYICYKCKTIIDEGPPLKYKVIFKKLEKIRTICQQILNKFWTHNF